MNGISFIVPAFNEEKLIRQCILSIYLEMQRYPKQDYEILVIDNGSTDKTVDVVYGLRMYWQYPGYPIFVYHEGQKGVVRARQKGYKEAKYDLLAFVDADNQLFPFWVQRMLKHFENPKVIAVSGPIVYCDMRDSIRYLTNVWYSLGKLAHHLIHPMIQGGNFVIRKSVMDKTDGFDTSVEFWGEDTMVAHRFKKLGKIVWDNNFNCHSSGRRMEEQGVANTGFKYITNYLSVAALGRPWNSEYKDFRP